MKKSHSMLVSLLGAFALIGPAQGQNGDTDSKYYVTYEWVGGALPPRFHYQYLIKVDSSGEGSIVMVPEYPSIYDTDIPRWKETFSADADQLRKLKGFIETNKMLSQDWRDPSPLANVGPDFWNEPKCTIEIRTGNKRNSPGCIDWEVLPVFRKKRDEFVDMMKKLVPAKSWARLNDAQRQYSTHG